MKKISDMVKDFLEETGCPFEQTDDKTDFKIGFGGDNGNFSTLVTVSDGKRMLEVYTLCPINVPKPKLPATAELVARINCNLSLGSFNIDMDDGQITFRTGVSVGHMDLDNETLHVLVYGNFLMMDNHFPAIASVAYGEVPPKKAIQFLQDAKDECTQEREDDSVEEESPSHKRFNGHMGFFSDN